MKKTVLVLSVLLLVLCTISASAEERSDEIFQAATIRSLMAGSYNGFVDFAQLKRHGDFGLGTFDGLDGEMVALDGAFFQVGMDGKPVEVSDETTSPWAMVTYFDPDLAFTLSEPLDYAGLKAVLNGLRPSEHLFYAVRVDGWFDYVKVRSVPKQATPYPPLVAVVKHQGVFEYRNVQGSLVGFWCPEVSEGISVPGYHFHFLSADRSVGGHVLDVSLKRGSAVLDVITDFRLTLPMRSGDDVRLNEDGRVKKSEYAEVEGSSH